MWLTFWFTFSFERKVLLTQVLSIMLFSFITQCITGKPLRQTTYWCLSLLCHCHSFSQHVVEQQLSSYMEKGGYEEDFTTVDANLLLSVVQTMVIIRPLSKSFLLLWLVVVVLVWNVFVCGYFPVRNVLNHFLLVFFFFTKLLKMSVLRAAAPMRIYDHTRDCLCSGPGTCTAQKKCCLPLK